jgi:hypothetical protein
MSATKFHIETISPDDFCRILELEVSYGNTTKTTRESKERFILTAIGGRIYAVSIEHGYAYTRPQLIQKYSAVGAEWTAVRMSK